jgi:hypothetical protein
MPLTVDRFQELDWHHARDERLRVHLHLQAIREASRADGSRNRLRRWLGCAIVRVGRRVAGGSLDSPALVA